MSVLKVEALTKRFADVLAVDDLSFSVEPGEIYGFLGGNGAGKTTTLRMVLDIIRPTSGRIEVLGGAPDRRNTAAIGFLPEERGLYGNMSAIDAITYFGRMKQMAASDAKAHGMELLKRFDLGDRAKAKISEMSKGMAQKVQLATAIDRQGQIALEAGDITGSLEYHHAELRLLEAGPDSQRKHQLVRHALSVAYGHLADAQVEAADLKGALASHRRSLAIRRELAGEHPENQVYADNVSNARYYLASVLGRLGQWEEALALHRQNFAADSTGGFVCRIGEALVELGRHEEGLGYFRRALTVHLKDLRTDTVNLFRKLAVLEDEARICKTLARLERPDAPDNCRRATSFMDAIEVEPEHAFPRAFMAAAWTNLGDAYAIMGTVMGPAAPPADRRSYRAAALEMHARSLATWTDLEARKLVSPVDTGRITAARRAVANAKALARMP